MAKKATATLGSTGGLLDGLTDKHGEVKVHFDNMELRWRGTSLGVELSGSLVMSAHVRDLTDDEKRAHVRENLGRIRAK